MNFELTILGTADEYPPGMSYSAMQDADKLRAKVRKLAEYLGPWCPNCGKRGTTCTGRSVSGCKARALKRAMRGFDSAKFHGHTLPIPPDDWMVSRNYGTRSHGGRVYWKANKYDDRDMRTHYAYEVAMGRADTADDVAA